jgi:hypothetical protein
VISNTLPAVVHINAAEREGCIERGDGRKKADSRNFFEHVHMNRKSRFIFVGHAKQIYFTAR